LGYVFAYSFGQFCIANRNILKDCQKEPNYIPCEAKDITWDFYCNNIVDFFTTFEVDIIHRYEVNFFNFILPNNTTVEYYLIGSHELLMIKIIFWIFFIKLWKKLYDNVTHDAVLKKKHQKHHQRKVTSKVDTHRY
jgi:hypothetical protein